MTKIIIENALINALVKKWSAEHPFVEINKQEPSDIVIQLLKDYIDGSVKIRIRRFRK